jgi:mono/diheme cytochrome c family protein
MTLLQANAEAVARHYRRPDPLPMATAITAYLTELGAGLPVSPGVSPGQPVFPERIRQLEASVDRGASVFIARCGSCHRSAEVASAVGTFPRGNQPLETFLAGHRPSGPPLDWAGQDVADVVAYLVARTAGRPVGGRPSQARKETP